MKICNKFKIKKYKYFKILKEWRKAYLNQERKKVLSLIFWAVVSQQQFLRLPLPPLKELSFFFKPKTQTLKSNQEKFPDTQVLVTASLEFSKKKDLVPYTEETWLMSSDISPLKPSILHLKTPLEFTYALLTQKPKKLNISSDH